MVHIIGAGDERMPTSGMKVKQAINEARRWWNKDGRDYFRRQRERENDGVKDDEELMFRSNILPGRLFDQCTEEEKKRIVIAWHDSWLFQKEGIDLKQQFNEFDGHAAQMEDLR